MASLVLLLLLLSSSSEEAKERRGSRGVIVKDILNVPMLFLPFNSGRDSTNKSTTDYRVGVEENVFPITFVKLGHWLSELRWDSY